MKEIVDEMVGAFDRHLEDSAASSKQHFRWMKRRYREKVDVNRAASKIELKDTILLDRCILEDKTKEIDDQYKEDIARLRVEFQLERSTLGKQRRELEQSVEVLRLEKVQAEEDASQAHRYIEALEDGAALHSEDGSVRSHKHSPRGGGRKSVGTRGSSRHASLRTGSAQASRRSSNHHQLHRQDSLNPGGNSPRGGAPRHAFAVAGAGAGASPRSPRSPRQTAAGGHTGGRSSLRGVHHQLAGGGAAVAVASPQDTARSPRGGGSGQNTGRLASGQNTGRKAFVAGEGGGSVANNIGSSRQLINPAARHEEARQRFEKDVASKLMEVIEKKKLAHLQEELADEVKNREAATARLELMSQAIPKLHKDLTRVQDQLVQSRMENNELRNINTVLTTDLVRASTLGRQDRNTAVSDAEAILIDHAAAGDRDPIGSTKHLSLRRAAGSIVGALRLDNRQNGRGGEGGGAGQQQEGTAGLRKAKEMGQWVVLQPTAENAPVPHGGSEELSTNEGANEGIARELITTLKRQVTGLEQERDAAAANAAVLLSDMDDLREERGHKHSSEEAKLAADETQTGKKMGAVRLECENLKEIRRDLESKLAKMQVESDENEYLRRRLEAIERTTLKLNIGGGPSDLQILRERLDLESAEVVRLRSTVAGLQEEKLVLAEEKVDLEYELERLTKFKAEFENLAESSLNDSDSEGLKGGDGGGSAAAGCGDGKWKQQAKRLQKYVKWQLAEAENQAQRDRAQMALESRSHDILMAEMSVLARRYRRELGRRCEVNRTLLQRLAELEGQVRPSCVRTGHFNADHHHRRRKVLQIAAVSTVATVGQCGNPRGGRTKTRDRAGSGRSGLRHHQRGNPAAAAPTLSPVALVPVHTIENAPEVVAASATARQRELVSASASVPMLAMVEAPTESKQNDTGMLRSRPRTSTGSERRSRNNTALEVLATKGSGKNAKAEETLLKKGVDALARQLRSTVREEFFGPPSESARERVKDFRAATARHTTRDAMVLGKPLSSITGSVLTNVPLAARTRGVAGDVQ
ncbi:unnamed protein product, partial [Hapterophycus canaliculatus]